MVASGRSCGWIARVVDIEVVKYHGIMYILLGPKWPLGLRLENPE